MWIWGSDKIMITDQNVKIFVESWFTTIVQVFYFNNYMTEVTFYSLNPTQRRVEGQTELFETHKTGPDDRR